jgi:hypothetical protein
MIEAPWMHRPRPLLGTPGHEILRGTPTTLAELRALRMELRAALGNGGGSADRRARTTTTAIGSCWPSRS